MGIGLKSYHGKFCCAEGGGGGAFVANRDAMAEWETFEIITPGNGKIALRTIDQAHYVSAEDGGGREVDAIRDGVGGWECFSLYELGGDRIALVAANGQWVCAEPDGSVVANRNDREEWETFLRVYDGGVQPALYGPADDQFINHDNGVPLEQPAGHTMTITFEVGAYNEFAICGYEEAAWLAKAGSPKLYERGNHTRGQDPWSEPAGSVVRTVIAGWYKTGPPDWHKPWLQARGRVESSDASWSGNIRTLRQVITFEDDPGAGYGAGKATVTIVGPL